MKTESRHHLQEHGWVVMKSVIPTAVCDAVVSRMEEFLQHPHSQVAADMKDPSTWLERLPREVTHYGASQTFGHFQELWDIRQDPNMAQLWADYYGLPANRMLVSMDRWGYWQSGAMTLEMRAKRWFHFDQGGQDMPVIPETKQVYECIQGYINLRDSDHDDDGNLLVLDGSHKLHKPYYDTIEKRHGKEARLQGSKRRPNNFVPLADGWMSDIDPEVLPAGVINDPSKYPEVAIKSRKGDVVMWYSTTAHQGLTPLPSGKTRCVAYISYAPRSLLQNPVDLDRRKRAWMLNRVTAHWASCWIRFSTAEKQDSDGYKYTRNHVASHPIVLTDFGKAVLGQDMWLAAKK